jgi:hypothetical protein
VIDRGRASGMGVGVAFGRAGRTRCRHEHSS